MNEEEFIRLAEKFRGTVYRVAFCYVRNQADAEDIMQEVFLKLYTSGGFADDEHTKAWLIRVTINRCKSLLRSSWHRLSLPLEAAENLPSEQSQEDSLLPLLLKLKPKYQAVMYMFYYEDYSVKDIAAILGESKSAITTRLARGRKQLRELLIKEGYYEL